MRFMNNLKQKLNTLCHQNYIGSEKCVAKDCNDGHKCLGYHEDTDEYEWGMCDVCKGKGYTIPLEFGCEILYNGEISKYIFTNSNEKSSYLKIYYNGYKEYTHSINFNWDFENLGKPLTLQMVWNLLGEVCNKSISIDTLGFVYVTSELDAPCEKIFQIDLTKDPKDWSDETLQAIIDIVE
jgi:hypothetical protein